jgi:hypothetical protein
MAQQEEAPRKTTTLKEFSGMNTQDLRFGVEDNEFAWLENIMRVGDGKLHSVPGPTAELARYPITTPMVTALGGVGGTGAVGSVTRSQGGSFSGVAGSTTVGSLGSSRTLALSGVVATGATGNFPGFPVSINLTGVSATTGVGTVTAVIPSFLLKEDGGFLLLEDGGKIII